MFSGNVKYNMQFDLTYTLATTETRVFNYLDKYETNNYYVMSYDDIIEFYRYLRDNFRDEYMTFGVIIDGKLKIAIKLNPSTKSIIFYE